MLQPRALAQCSHRHHSYNNASHPIVSTSRCTPVVTRHFAPLIQRGPSSSLVVLRASSRGGDVDETRAALAKMMQLVSSLQSQLPNDNAADTAAATTNDPNHARERQLWERQAALYDRAVAQWDAERAAALAREAALQRQVEALQQQLLHVTWQLQQQAQAHAHAAAAAAAAAAAQAQGPTLLSGAAPPFGTLPDAASASPSGRSFEPGTPSAAASPVPPAAAAAAAAPSASSSVSSTTTHQQQQQQGAPAWAELFASTASDESALHAGGSASGSSASSTATSPAPVAADGGGEVPGFAREIAAAMAMVDSADVLTDDLDLSTLSVRRTAAAAPAAAPSAPAAAPAAAAAPPPAPPPVAAPAADVGGVETQRAPPNGPPPLLSAGDDDIYWVSKLHAALGGAGYYAPDDEAEDFYFGEGTAAALLSYQACQGLPETGVTDDATWAALLGSDAVASGGGGGAEAQQQQQDGAASASSSSSNGSGSSSTAAAAAAETPPRATWPVVMDGDGGREVHALHVALGRAGFHCGEDDMRWWMFGDPTGNALRTFQASSKLPESGVCDERTWLALLGAGAQPRMVDELKADDSEFEDDMAAPHEGAVWLLGEQRWSRPV